MKIQDSNLEYLTDTCLCVLAAFTMMNTPSQTPLCFRYGNTSLERLEKKDKTVKICSL